MAIFSFFRKRRRAELESKGPASSKGRRRVEQDSPSRGATYSRRLIMVLMMLLVWAAAALSYRQRPSGSVDFVIGQVAGTNVFAETDFEWVDQLETTRRRDKAAATAPDVYRVDTQVEDQVRQDFRWLFDYLNRWEPDAAEPKLEGGGPQEAMLMDIGYDSMVELKALFDNGTKQSFFLEKLDEQFRDRILPADTKADTQANSQQTKIVIRTALGHDEYVDNMLRLPTPLMAARSLMREIENSFTVANPRSLMALAEKLGRLIRPNLVYDAQLTNDSREALREQVPEVMRTEAKGSVFIRKGDKIAERDLAMLHAHSRAMHQSTDLDSLRQTAAFLVLSLLAVIGGAVFLNVGHPKLSQSLSNTTLIGLVLTLNILVIWGVEQSLLLVLQGAQVYVYAAMPMFLTSVLLSLLLGPSAGMTVGVILALLCTLTSEGSVHVLVLGMVQAVVGSLSVRSARTRLQTFRAALYTPIAVFLVECVYLLVQNWTPAENVLIVLVMSFVTGIVTLMLINLMLPICEWLFGITTNISLLELSDLNHPLLKRLQLEAPGTYHHTLMVATLAEHAAEAIGANTLQARVAAYFHDVGKLSNPAYFTENNFGQKNQHDELNPHMSARIIVNHVKEGLEMAKAYKLRAPIREAIASHHGTSLVFYFYHRARQERRSDSDAEVNEASFRYPGPLPRSPECTIISLADSCEAASRSLSKPSPQKIDALVSEIVRNRLLDGQLDESELTMDELNRVVEAIKRTLRSMLHGRVAYPKDEEPSPAAAPMSPRQEVVTRADASTAALTQPELNRAMAQTRKMSRSTEPTVEAVPAASAPLPPQTPPALAPTAPVATNATDQPASQNAPVNTPIPAIVAPTSPPPPSPPMTAPAAVTSPTSAAPVVPTAPTAPTPSTAAPAAQPPPMPDIAMPFGPPAPGTNGLPVTTSAPNAAVSDSPYVGPTPDAALPPTPSQEALPNGPAPTQPDQLPNRPASSPTANSAQPASTSSRPE